MAPSPFLESSGQKHKGSQEQQDLSPCSLPLPRISLAHNLLFHKDLGCYLGLTHLSLGNNLRNVSCLEPGMALKTTGLWTVCSCWGLASRACPKENPGLRASSLPMHMAPPPWEPQTHTYHSPGSWLKQKRTSMCCHRHRRQPWQQ